MQREYKWDSLSRYRQELYGFSILWIMLFHFPGKYPLWVKSVLAYGNMGVELFLFASGVSLYFAMQKKPTLSAYYGRRLVRVLVPIFIISSWEWIPQFLEGKLGFLKLLMQWTGLNFWITGGQQNWFLSFILIAYLLYPYIYSFLYEGTGKVWERTLILTAISVIIAVMISKYATDYYDAVEIALTRFPVFIIGCAFGRTIYEKKTVQKNAGWMLLGLSILIVLSFIVLNLKLVKGMQKRYFYLLPGIALSILLPAIFDRIHTRWGKSGRFLRYLGNRSLELYLLHLMLGNHLFTKLSFFDRKNVIHWYLMLASCVLLSYPAHKLVTMLSSLLTRKKRA